MVSFPIIKEEPGPFRKLAMSWYSKPRWWEKESSEKDWHEKGEWKGTSVSKNHWKGQRSEWQNDWSKGTEWSKSHGTWKSVHEAEGTGGWQKSGEKRDLSSHGPNGGYDWKTSHDWKKHDWKNPEKTGEHQTSTSQGPYPASHPPHPHRPSQWVAKNSRSQQGRNTQAQAVSATGEASSKVEQPPVDPVVALESSLTEIEELLGEKLVSTRALLEDSEQNAREAVGLATVALELLSQKTAFVDSDEDLQRVLRAKASVRELLMWRNFGLKMWLHNKPDPMNFQTYDAEVQQDLKQTWTKIEQKLMQELVAGDSWSKLARKLRFCVSNKEFSGEMRALLTRIINTCELTHRAKQRRQSVELSEVDHALFEEMASDEQFGNDVINAVRNDRFRKEGLYPNFASERNGPSWMHQMLGWQGHPGLHGQMMQGPGMVPMGSQGMPAVPQHLPRANPWETWAWSNSASSA